MSSSVDILLLPNVRTYRLPIVVAATDPKQLSLHGSIIITFPLGPGRNEFGPAVVRVRTAKSAVAGDHLLHAHFVGWQTAIVRKEIALTRSEEHTSELQSLRHLVCRLLLEKKKEHNR